jgi:hypothetical protein
MKFDDFTWNDIIFEAPDDTDDGMDELSASDYADAEGMDIESEDPAGEDPTAEEGEGDPADEDPLAEDGEGEGDPADEDPLAEDGEGEGDPADEDPLAEDGEGDSANEKEQTDNAENDVNADIQNKHLANDFIELYHRIDEIMNQIRTDCKTNIRYNPNMQTVRRNLTKLKETTYAYITNKFTKESYVTNLYQFNLIIQALNVNIELLSSVLDSNRAFKEKQNGRNKKKTQKKTDK